MAYQTNEDRFIAILVNPRSGRGKASKTGQWLTGKLAERNIPHCLFAEEWPLQFEGFTELWNI